jgi:cytochrome c
MSRLLKVVAGGLIVLGVVASAGVIFAVQAEKPAPGPTAVEKQAAAPAGVETPAIVPEKVEKLAAAPAMAEKPSPVPAVVKQAPRKIGIGREAKPEEVAGWDIDIRPDGQGLPVGSGTPKQGETIFSERCAACHGEFGESIGKWPILAGGTGTIASEDPVRSIGSYWPYASTVIDYIRRAMPYGDAQSLTNDELYAVSAYVFYLNDIITDENFVLSNKNFASLKLPNEANFHDDDRETTERSFWKAAPCMTNCAAGKAEITAHASVVDVTPEAGKGPKVD